MQKLLRLMIPDTCKRQLRRAVQKNRDAVESVICTLDECTPALVVEMKAERRIVRRVIGR